MIADNCEGCDRFIKGTYLAEHWYKVYIGDEVTSLCQSCEQTARHVIQQLGVTKIEYYVKHNCMSVENFTPVNLT